MFNLSVLLQEWTYMSCINGNFLNMTNNRLESINGKLKSVIKEFSSFPGFLASLFSIIRSMRQERSHFIASTVMKTPVQKFPAGSAEELYQKLLNPYPFQIMLKLIATSADLKTTAVEDGANYT